MKTRKVILILATMAALLGLALFATVASADQGHPPHGRASKGSVQWTPRMVRAVVSPTVESTVEVTVTSNTTITGASIRAVGSSLGKVITIAPAKLDLDAKVPVKITLTIKTPAPAATGDDEDEADRGHAYGGVLMLFDSRNRPVPLPLPVVINPPHHR